MDNALEVGRVKRDDKVDIIIRRGDFNGRSYVDIREYLTTEAFAGFTKRGIMIPSELYVELVQELQKA